MSHVFCVIARSALGELSSFCVLVYERFSVRVLALTDAE